MKKGNKIIQCGGCGKRIVAKMIGKKGYAACNCKHEYYITNDKFYGLSQKLAKI